MSQVKHYNIFALRGDTETTDQDVCDTLGLDPALANTPAINDAAIKKMHQENFQAYLSKGMDEKTAGMLSDSKAQAVKNEIKSLMKEQ